MLLEQAVVGRDYDVAADAGGSEGFELSVFRRRRDGERCRYPWGTRSRVFDPGVLCACRFVSTGYKTSSLKAKGTLIEVL